MSKGKRGAEYAGVQIGTGPSGDSLPEGAITVTVDGKDAGLKVRTKPGVRAEAPIRLFDGKTPEPSYFASEPE